MFELIHVLPRLKVGVVVHIHDIFLPFDYPAQWMKLGARQYTEQWVLATFLHNNLDWEIIWPNHYMMKHANKLALPNRGNREDCGSFWIRKIR